MVHPSDHSATPSDFIRRIVSADLAETGGRAVTRFPPEPNGYLHIGHAKSMCLNFGVAGETGGLCRLRFDDTNPLKESREFAEAIRDDVRWLGFGWEGEPRHASDYFEEMYGYARGLIRSGSAYVDSQSAEEIRNTRGTLTRPREGESVAEPPRRGERRSVREDAQRGVSRRGARAPGPDRHGPPATSTCVTPCCTASGTRPTPIPATPGASIPRTTSPRCCRTRSRGSPIPCVPSSSRITGRSMTGSWTIPARPPGPARSSSPGSTSSTP